MLNRRDLLLLYSGFVSALPPVAYAGPRWATTNPAEWTPNDIDTVLNRSPWVREVLLAMPDPGPAAGAAPGSIPSEFRVLVRWESGLPIRLARKSATCQRDSGEYVLSVSRLPLAFAAVLASGGPARRKRSESLNTAEMAARIAAASFLQREGHEPIAAARSEWVDADLTSRLMLYFDGGKEPIQLADREVSLASAVGSLTFVARFQLKQMVYRGNLEL